MPTLLPVREYVATLLAVHDGDTVTADVDLGFYTWIRGTRLRFAGINAPELPTVPALKAKQFVVDNLPATFVIRTTKNPADNYGNRFDAWLLLPDGRCLNRMLVDSAHAVPYGSLSVDPPT